MLTSAVNLEHIMYGREEQAAAIRAEQKAAQVSQDSASSSSQENIVVPQKEIR